jgi:hypothetical protein
MNRRISELAFSQDAQKDCPARPQRMEKAEVEVKVKHQTDSCLLNLSLSLNLPITLADFFSTLPGLR